MFWRSVVGKLAITILLLVSFVLFILIILLLEFFKNFHVQEAEKVMLQTANKVSVMIEHYDEKHLIFEQTESVKDPFSRVVIVFKDGSTWTSNTENDDLLVLEEKWLQNDLNTAKVLTERKNVNKQLTIPDEDLEIMIVGVPVLGEGGAVFVYQSLDVINHTRAETTRIIFLAAGIAIILTTIFAFFLSTRITAPLIKMREAAFDLTRGEFNTKVPILTNDEIGELATAFNRMGKQLNFHIHALRQEKEQLSSIVVSMADGVITLNRDGQMIMTNPPAERFLADWYYEHNMVNIDDNKTLPYELREMFERIIDGEQKSAREIILQGRSWVMIMTPLYDQSRVRGAVVVLRDMTEERRLDKLRKDFIANVSHELRTPISLMQGYSEAIVDDIAESRSEKNELAEIIYEESLRMGRLVNELLDLARMEAGHAQLNVTHVNLDEFSKKMIKKFQGIAEERDITLSLSTNIENTQALFDHDQMEQVFTNLIDNALDHTNEHGEVHVNIESNDETITVHIKDSGKGIPEGDLPFIFERFYKADKSRTRNGAKKGTGLGLAIVKNIVEAHEGTITVKSKVNVGTTFSFTIPRMLNHLYRENDLDEG